MPQNILLLPIIDLLNSCNFELAISFLLLLIFSISLFKTFNFKSQKIIFIPSIIFIILVFLVQMMWFLGFLLSMVPHFMANAPLIMKAVDVILIIFILGILGGFYSLYKKTTFSFNNKTLVILPIIFSLFLSTTYKLNGLICQGAISLVFSQTIGEASSGFFYYLIYSLIMILPFIVILLILKPLIKCLNKLSERNQKITLSIVYIVSILFVFLLRFI